MTKYAPADLEKWWDKVNMDINGKKPAMRLCKLVKSKWPKLYNTAMKRQRRGIWVQAAVTALLDQSGVKVVDTERDCGCAECAVCARREDRPHDVDILVELAGYNVPLQVSVFYGARWHDDDVVDKEYGAVNTKTANERDTMRVRHKIRQTPPGGITLLVTTMMVSPSDDWWHENVDERCIVLRQNDSCSIYNGVGGRVDAAEELCRMLGCKYIYTRSVKSRHSQDLKHQKRLQFQPDTADGLADAVRKDTKKWTDDPDEVMRELYYPAYASAYFRGLYGVAVQTDNLVPIIQHVVERHRESAAEAADDEAGWRRSVSDMLQALEKMTKPAGVKFSVNTLVDICHILQKVASGRHENRACQTLSISEIDRRLHLHALYCITCAVYRLRDKTPPDVLETLTNAARLVGQDGWEHRIVLGCALGSGLRSAIPDWYTKNESLLFGKDAPNGMNSALVRVCSLEYTSNRTDTAHPVLDVQTMEKYHTVVLEALDEEMQYMRSRKSKTGERVTANDLMRCFMRHVLHGSRGYGVEDSVQCLARIGPDAVCVAGHEYGFLINTKTEKELVDRGVQFWEAVLDSSPEPAALYGFGWCRIESIDQNIWERLMLRTCEIAGGLVDMPSWVINRASFDGNPSESGIRIIELVRRANNRPHTYGFEWG